MQEEPKPTPKPKKKRISTRVLLIVLGLLLVVAAIGVILYFAVIKDNRPVVDCQKIISDSKKLYADKKYKESYELTRANIDKCIDNPNNNSNTEKILNSSSDKATRTEVYTVFAVSAFKSGDKDQAIKLAETALKSSISMTPEERSKMPNSNRMISDAFAIKNGFYQ